MAEPAKYFNNVILGQFVLTGIPLDVHVDGRYLRIPAVDDLEDPMYGFGMDADGAMHEFDYRMIDHILVNGNNITLDTYNKAMGGATEKPKAEEPEEEESTKKEESTMRLKPMLADVRRVKTNEDVNTARQKVQKEKENVAKAEEKLANAQSVYAKEKMKAAKMEENADVTSVSEPYIFKVGDMVRNINPSCPHYGSMGIVQKLLTLPDNMGTLVKYTVTNDGDTYSAGDSLTKTMDQLGMAYDDELDFNDYDEEYDEWDVVGMDDDMSDWDEEEDYEYYDDEDEDDDDDNDEDDDDDDDEDED